jgi:transposase InsO family protein
LAAARRILVAGAGRRLGRRRFLFWERFSAEQIVVLLRQIEVLRAVPRSRNFAAELRDECLNGEIFYSLKEATVVIEQWRNQYNRIRPHSSLNYRPPAPQTSTALSLHLDRSYTMQ